MTAPKRETAPDESDIQRAKVAKHIGTIRRTKRAGMATIRERTAADGSITFAVRVRLRGHPEQSRTFKRKTDARKWASATKSALREGRDFPKREAENHILSEAIARYREEVLLTCPLERYQLLSYSYR